MKLLQNVLRVQVKLKKEKKVESRDVSLSFIKHARSDELALGDLPRMSSSAENINSRSAKIRSIAVQFLFFHFY